jgi:hypothetical protein
MRYIIEPLLPRSGGDTAEYERNLEMQGFHIKDGVVTAPTLELSEKTKTDYYALWGETSPALHSLIKDMGAAALTSRQANWKGEYQAFKTQQLEGVPGQVGQEGVRGRALKSGTFVTVYDEASVAYDKFVEDFAKEHGSDSKIFLKAEIEYGKRDIAAWSLNLQTAGAREYAATNIRAIAATAGNIIRLDPTSIYEQVRQIEAQQGTFAIALDSAAAGKQYMEDLRAVLIMGAIQETGFRSAEQAVALYKKYKEQDDANAKAERAPILTPEQHLKISKLLEQYTQDHIAADLEQTKDKEALQLIQKILGGETRVTNPKDAAIHDAVDRVMANYDQASIQNDPLMKRSSREDIIIKTGYIPKTYMAIQNDLLHYGTNKSRVEAATNILRIANDGLSTGDQMDKDLVADAFKLATLAQGVGIDAAISIIDTKNKEPKVASDIMQKKATDWFNEDKRDKKDVVSKVHSKVFSAGFFGSSERLPSDFEALFETQAKDLLSFNYIDSNMSKPAAQAAAGGTLMKVWGNAQVLNSPNYKTYRPIQKLMEERKIKKEDFENQLKSSYASLTTADNKSLPKTKNLRIHWIYDHKTTGAPIYQVYEVEKSGAALRPIMIKYTDKKGVERVQPWYIDSGKFQALE